ncbi:hypothetical protein BH23ACT3_BH23ACT3_17010 [soil metagenome]
MALWLSRSFWLPGRYVVAFDTFAYSGPNYRVTIDQWRAGRLPLWNDLIFGGVTHAGNPQAGVFSPTKLVGLLFDTNRAMNITVALHLVLMAVTTVFLLRRLGARPPAALVAAVVMVANGAVLARSIQFEQIVVLAWTPALLWGITVVLEPGARRWGAMAGTATVTAMVLVAGHPQIVYQVIVMAVAWTVAMAVTGRDHRRLLDLAAAVALGALAASVHLLAAVAATRDSAITTGRDLDDLASPLLSVRPHHLAQLLLGSVRHVDDAAFAGGFESIGHLGVAGAFLAVMGIVLLAARPGRRAIAVVMAITMVLATVWALGPRTPLFRWAYDWVPGFDLARGSARWLGVTAVFAAIAAGLGMAELARRLDTPRGTTDGVTGRLIGLLHVAIPAAMLLGVIALGALDVVLMPGRAVVVPWVVVAAVMIALVAVAAPRAPALALVALTVVVGAEMITAARHSPIAATTSATSFDALDPGPAGSLAGREGLAIAYTDDAWADTAYLVAGFRPNTNVLAGVASLDGYDGGVQVTERFAALIERLSPAPEVELPLRNNLPLSLDLGLASELGLRWVLMDDRWDPEVLLPGWVATEMSDETFTVWENPAWIGDAVMVEPDGVVRPAAVDRRSPAHLVVDVSVDPGADVNRTLVVHRQTAPGWSADIDGEAVALAPGDGFFLTVDVPAGATKVELRYRPRWLLPGLMGSMVGLAGIAAMAAVALAARRRSRQPTEPTVGPRADMNAEHDETHAEPLASR